MPHPSVSIIIPVFNQWSYTAACLESLLRATSSAGELEILVVDNASTDETAAELAHWQHRWSAIRIERLSSNTGFSPACNRGAEVARGTYLVFLNNDTEPQPGWLEPLIAEVDKPGVGVAGPKLLYPGGKTINHAGYVYSNGNFYGIYHERPADLPGANKPRSYQALLGACLAMRRDLFDSLGRFSLYGLEDIDLCLKAREAGLESRYVPSSVVFHHGSVTLRQSPPGSFPETTCAAFGERWGKLHIIWDDFSWYLEDGEWVAPPGATDLATAKKIAVESMQRHREGEARIHAGDETGGELLLREALTVWPHNPWAFVALCKNLARRGRRSEVHALLGRLRDFVAVPFVISDLEPVLKAILPPAAYAEVFGPEHS